MGGGASEDPPAAELKMFNIPILHLKPAFAIEIKQSKSGNVM